MRFQVDVVGDNGPESILLTREEVLRNPTILAQVEYEAISHLRTIARAVRRQGLDVDPEHVASWVPILRVIDALGEMPNNPDGTT